MALTKTQIKFIYATVLGYTEREALTIAGVTSVSHWKRLPEFRQAYERLTSDKEANIQEAARYIFKDKMGKVLEGLLEMATKPWKKLDSPAWGRVKLDAISKCIEIFGINKQDAKPKVHEIWVRGLYERTTNPILTSPRPEMLKEATETCNSVVSNSE